MALMLPVHVGATGRAAREAMRAGVLKYYQNLEVIFSQLPDSYTDHLPRLKMIRETLANLPYEKFCRDQGVFGDASEVIERLQAAREDFRRKGIAREFYKSVEAVSPSPRVFSSTEETNAASIRMHTALGFQPSGHVDNLPQGVRELLFYKRIPPRSFG